MFLFPSSLSLNYDACLHAYTQMCQYTCFRRTKWLGFHLTYQIFMQVPSWVSISRRSSPHADNVTNTFHASGIALYPHRLAYTLQIKGRLYHICCLTFSQVPNDANMYQKTKPPLIRVMACLNLLKTILVFLHAKGIINIGIGKPI